MGQKKNDALNKAYREQQQFTDDLLMTSGLFAFCTGRAEEKIAEKLNGLHVLATFWDDVRKLTRNVHSDRSIRMWQGLAELRHRELELKDMIQKEAGKIMVKTALEKCRFETNLDEMVEMYGSATTVKMILLEFEKLDNCARAVCNGQKITFVC